MTREKYSCYEFEIKKAIVMKESAFLGFVYEIYGTGCLPYYDGVIESEEWFDTEQEARFAAIGHIDLLENGEG
jgi:hypothetical protein